MTKYASNVFFTLLPKLNMLLGLAACVLALYLVRLLTQPFNPEALGINLREVKLHALSRANQQVPALKGISFEESAFSKKEIFNNPALWKGELAQKKFILLGVSVGVKKLAMIRNPVDGKEHYCAEGDRIGDFTVKMISKEKVILESPEGEAMEIYQ